MKVKKLLLLMLALMLSLTLAVSCGDDGGDSSQGGSDSSGDGSGDTSGGGSSDGSADGYDPLAGLFSKGCKVNIVYSDEENAKSSANKLYSAIYTATGVSPSENGTGEYDVSVILGESTHPASVAAYRRLSRLQKTSDDFLAYVVYSDGENFAIAYDIDERHAAALTGAGRLIDRLAQGAIKPGVGVLYKGTFDMEAYYQAEDDEYVENKWNELAEYVGGELGVSIVEAFKDHYRLYSDDVISWVANLYEPYVCFCEGGVCTGSEKCGGKAFYYSNAARDNYGFLPDVESTIQVLEFMSNTGMLDQYYGGSYVKALPESMREGITHFVKSLQDKDGWFYHPQWDREFLTTNRRSRDLVWCEKWLKGVGIKPYYDTPNGLEGESSNSFVSYSLPLRMSSSVIAASKVISASSAEVPSHLLTKESLIAYLNGLDIRNNSYSVGNLLTTQTGQFTARDRTLAAQGANWRTLDVITDWLTETQNPKTGTWDYKEPGDEGYSDYFGVNGVLKIYGLFSTAGRVFPCWEEAIQSAVRAIRSAEEIGAIVDMYNGFWTVSGLASNVRAFAPGGAAKADAINKMMLESAPEFIRIATRKIAGFKKPDGSFSYGRKYSSLESQGMVVTLPNQVEGDVNGNGIAINGVTEHLYSSFGLSNYRVPIFTDNDRRELFKIIDSLDSVIKDEFEIIKEPIDFEADSVGSPSLFVSATMFDLGKTTVVKDERDGGKALEIKSTQNALGNDLIRWDIPASVSNPASFVFAADFCLLENTNDFSIYIDMGGAFQFSLLENKAKGTVEIWENSSTWKSYSMQTCVKDDIAVGEWFTVKAVYYLGDDSTVRIKMYCNDELLSVTDNFGNENGHKVRGLKYKVGDTYNYASIMVDRYASAHLLVDNIYSYRDKERYVKESDPDNQPKINIDAPDVGEKLYQFDDKLIPEEFTTSTGGGKLTVSNKGYLEIAGGASGESAKIRVPLNQRGEAASVAVMEADLTVTSADLGEIMELSFREDNRFDNDLMSYRLVVSEIDGSKYVSIHEAPDGLLGTLLGGVRVKVGKKMTLRIEYYEKLRSSVIYLDGEALTISTVSANSAIKYKSAVLEIKSVKGKSSKVRVDNLIAEKTLSDFDKLTGAQVSSVIHNFSKGLPEGASMSGAVTVGGEARFTGGAGILKIPVNRKAVLSSVYSVKTSVSLSGLPSSARVYQISLVDASDNKIVAFEIATDGGKAYLYDLSEHGPTSAPICALPTKTTIAFDFYATDKECVLYVGGKAVSVTSIYYSDDTVTAPAKYLKIESIGECKASFDNVVAEGRYATRVRPEMSGQNSEDKAEVLTFEDSFTGNIPELSITNHSSVKADTRIIGSYIDGVYSKALAFDTSVGSGDYVMFRPTKSMGSANCFVFESDIMLDSSLATTLYQLSLLDMGGNFAYMINMNVTTAGTVTLQETSHYNASGQKRVVIYQNEALVKEWFRLKIEYYEGTRETVRIRISVNDILIYISDNFFNSHEKSAKPLYDISSVKFAALNDSVGTIGFDNVSFIQTRGVCEDEVGKAPNAEDGSEILTFEQSTTNSTPSAISYILQSGAGLIDVIERTVSGAISKAIKFVTGPGGNDRFVISTTKSVEERTGSTFSADMSVSSEMADAIFQMFFGDVLDGDLVSVYMLQLDVTSDGYVNLVERASSTSSIKTGVILEKFARTGEWFNLKVEYFAGDAETVRIKIYLNGECRYISDNFYGNNLPGAVPNTELNSLSIISLHSAAGELLIDNVGLVDHTDTCTEYPTNYKPPVDKVEGPGEGLFAGEATADGFDGEENGYLSTNSSQTFTVPSSLGAGEVFVFEFDFRWTDLAKGTGYNPTWIAWGEIDYMSCGEDKIATDGTSRLTLIYNGGLNAFVGLGQFDYTDEDGDGAHDGEAACLEHGKWYNIRYEVHQNSIGGGKVERTVKLYVDGVLIASVTDNESGANNTPYSSAKISIRLTAELDFDNVFVGAKSAAQLTDEES